MNCIITGNYEPQFSQVKEGPGERGSPVKTKPEEAAMLDRSIQEYGFNQYASDKISLDRSIPDLRKSE